MKGQMGIIEDYEQDKLFTSDEIHKMVRKYPKITFHIKDVSRSDSHVIRIQYSPDACSYKYMILYPDNSGGESMGLWENALSFQRQKERFKVLCVEEKELKK